MFVLYVFDFMLSGEQMRAKYWAGMDPKQIKVLVGLFSNQLNQQTLIKCEPYITGTFNCFIENKTHISLRIDEYMEDFHPDIRDLVLHPIEKRLINRCDGDYTNLFKLEVLRVFKNVKSIFIDLSDLSLDDGVWKYYGVSFTSLLSIIKLSSLDQIILQLGGMWIQKEVLKCYSISSSLEKEYNEQHFKIEIKQSTGAENDYIWCIISRI